MQVAQLGVIAYGLWRWGKDIDARRRVLDERVAAWEREDREAEQRREESMAARRAQIERPAPARSPSRG